MTSRTRARQRLAMVDLTAMLMVLLCLLMAGCSSAGPVTPVPRPFSPQTTDVITRHDPTPTRSSPTGETSSQPAADTDMATDIDSAVLIVDRFWTEHFTQFFPGPYTSPQVGGAYRGTSGPTCGGQPSVAYNAFYCPQEDFLAWDIDLMTDGYAKGDSFVYFVMAHEWGHAIQARIDSTLVGPSVELQADCFAGATLQGATTDGNLVWEDGDDNEIVTALGDLGDSSPWTDQASHGTGLERAQAFLLGRQGGVAACLPAVAAPTSA